MRGPFGKDIGDSLNSPTTEGHRFSLQPRQIRKIKDVNVYIVTAVISLLAYLWRPGHVGDAFVMKLLVVLAIDTRLPRLSLESPGSSAW